MVERVDSDRFLTDALVERHKAETAALEARFPEGAWVSRGEWREHSLRQARELLEHAYEMERRLHAIFQEHRWCGKS